jgi:hypothetical protein
VDPSARCAAGNPVLPPIFAAAATMGLVRVASPPEWPAAPPLADGAPTQLDFFPSMTAAVTEPARDAGGDRDAPREPYRPTPNRDLLGSGLLLIGAVLVALGNVAVWSSAVAHDRDTYANAAVLDLEDGLDGLVRERVTSALVEWADLDQLIADALPGPLGLIGGPTEDLARTALDEAVDTVLAQEPFASTLDRLEASADRELVELLLADSDWFRLDGTTLVLDLDPLVQDAASRFDELVPDLLADAVPGLNAAALLPDDIEDGGVELAVGEVPVLPEARSELVDLDRVTLPFLVAAAGCAVLGIVVSTSRRRAFIVAGLAVSAAALAVGFATWTSGAPLAPSTDALRAIAGQSFTDVDGSGLLARSAALFAAGTVVAGLAAVSTTIRRPART